MKNNGKLLNQEVVEAFSQLMCIPLGAESNEEYMKMKKHLFIALGVIATEGNLKEEMTAGLELLIERMQSPEMLAFLQSQRENKPEN